jgi:hypothetical protein
MCAGALMNVSCLFLRRKCLRFFFFFKSFYSVTDLDVKFALILSFFRWFEMPIPFSIIAMSLLRTSRFIAVRGTFIDVHSGLIPLHENSFLC